MSEQLKNKSRTQVSISGLSYSNLLEDTYNAIKDSDSFKDAFTSFESNTAQRMIVELYCYIAEQLANRIDVVGNELFVDTASAAGLSRLLKLVGAKIDFPSAAHVEVHISTTSDITNDIVLSQGINFDGGDELTPSNSSFASIGAGNQRFEFIHYAVDQDTGRFGYDYTRSILLTNRQKDIVVCEGETKYQQHTIYTVKKDIITLPFSPVIQDSVTIYYREKVTEESGAKVIAKLKKVDNFFSTDALTCETGHYTVRNTGNGKCEIVLQPGKDDIGKEIVIMYRVGGGSFGNIPIGRIDTVFEYNKYNKDSGKTIGRGLINVYNYKSGTGGKNELTDSEIRYNIMNEVRNTKIAITEEDYDYLLPKYDPSVRLVKTYGEKNEPQSDNPISKLADTYGYYVNPLNVWLLLLKYNRTFDDLYKEGIENLTDRINDIAFEILDINPRFNEVYQINKASLNLKFSNQDLASRRRENSYTLPLDKRAVECLEQGNARITITDIPYVESSDPNRRGEKIFASYSGNAEIIETWENLFEKESADIDNVVLIKELDPNGEYCRRYICIKKFEEKISEEDWEEYWKLVDSVYVYDNLTGKNSEDAWYMVQSGDSITELYSKAQNSITFKRWEEVWEEQGGTDEEGRIDFKENETLKLNNSTINLSGLMTKEDFVDAINSQILPSVQMVTIKKDIESRNDIIVHSEDYEYSENVRYYIYNPSGDSYTITLNVSNISTYDQLIDAMNDNSNMKASGCMASLYSNANNCFDLVIISAEPFTFREDSIDFEAKTGLYTHYLANDNTLPYAMSIDSVSTEISIDVYNSDWSDYFENKDYPAIIKNGVVVIEPFADEIIIDGSDIIKRLLGWNITEGPKTIAASRVITCSYQSDNKSASIIIKCVSEEDIIDKTIYINVFGSSNTDIKLGSYYTDINNMVDIPSEKIKNLLKREPIKHLYPTKYFINDLGEKEENSDKYGSTYLLRFSAQKIIEQTFNQLGRANVPAKVTFVDPANKTMPMFGEDSYLYMKVDSNLFQGKTDVVLPSGELVDIPEVNGYARIDLNWFKGSTLLLTAETIVNKIFSEADGEEEKKLLELIEEPESSTVGFQTCSSDYASSIDFGNTKLDILSALFGINKTAILSKEGQIDAKIIPYSLFSLTNQYVMNKELKIVVGKKENNDDSIVADISVSLNTGYAIDDLKRHIAESELNGIIEIDHRRIILNDLTNNKAIAIEILYSDESEKQLWQNMFVNEFEDTPSNEGGGKLTLAKVNNGDYHVELNDQGEYILTVDNPEVFPYGDVYFHMYEDYTNDHIYAERDGEPVYTDEFIWNNLMSDKKTMLTSHVYKQPRFSPFDMVVTCYIPNTEYKNATLKQKEIENFLTQRYGLYADNIGENISPSDVIFGIRSNVNGVESVIVNYLDNNENGEDILSYAGNNKTTSNILKADYNQKLILSSKLIGDTISKIDPTTGELSELYTPQYHGLIVNIAYLGK